MQKSRKLTHNQNTKESIETDSQTFKIFELADKTFNVIIKMLLNLHKKIDKQKDG